MSVYSSNIYMLNTELNIMLIFMPAGWICFHLVTNEEYQNAVDGKKRWVPGVIHNIVHS